jgi:hypothetical protein
MIVRRLINLHARPISGLSKMPYGRENLWAKTRKLERGSSKKLSWQRAVSETRSPGDGVGWRPMVGVLEKEEVGEMREKETTHKD